MKKLRRKIIIVLVCLAIIGLLNINKVYADPNSSKGFAEYNDEQAEEEAQKMLEEQEKELKEAEGKSTNNYLENLKVEGYELTPNFDKQTIEYTIKGKVTSDEINIIATPNDAKATVQGAGKVKTDKNEYRIDVIAESGTVRTYTIHLTEVVSKQEEINPEEQDNNQLEQPTEETSSVIQENGKIESNNVGNNEATFDNSTILIIAFVILIALIITVLVIGSKKSKGKHNK